MERTYEQMTLTERAEAHILAARQHLGAANQNLAVAGNQRCAECGRQFASSAPGCQEHPRVLMYEWTPSLNAAYRARKK